MTGEEREEKISGLVERYRAGEFSDEVFTASIMRLVPDRDERRYLITIHQPTHRKAAELKMR